MNIEIYFKNDLWIIGHTSYIYIGTSVVIGDVRRFFCPSWLVQMVSNNLIRISVVNFSIDFIFPNIYYFSPNISSFHIIKNNFRIPDLNDPADRMIQVLRWYLSSFHAGRKVSLILLILLISKKDHNLCSSFKSNYKWRSYYSLN